jgi:hypothetical protein
MTSHTPLDSLKHAAAQAHFAIAGCAELRDRPPTPLTPEHLVAAYGLALDNLTALIDHHLAAHCNGENADVYSGGLPVMTRIDLSADTADGFAMVWHPDLSHPANQPRVVSEDARLANGERKRLLVTAPGVIAAVSIEESPQ